MSCCNHHDYGCGCCCHRGRRSKPLATIYYKIPNDSGRVRWVYAENPELGLQASTFNPVTDRTGGSNLPGQSIFFQISQLVTGTGGERSVLETFSYTDSSVSDKALFAATSQYANTPGSSTLTTSPRVVYAVTGGIGRFKRAKKAVIDFNNVTGLRTVRVYA